MSADLHKVLPRHLGPPRHPGLPSLPLELRLFYNKMQCTRLPNGSGIIIMPENTKYFMGHDIKQEVS